MRVKKVELVRLIKEAIVAELEEATYPEGFDLAAFKALPTFKDRLAYVKQRLPKVAQGSSRAVFIVDDATVLKVAMNKKGLAQNDVEIDIGRNQMGPVARVYEYGDNGAWLEMEKAQKATPKMFQTIAGFSLEELGDMLRYWHAENQGRAKHITKPARYEELVNSGENEFMNELIGMMGDYDMPPGDIERISSWGVVNRKGKPELVMIDFGLTSTVYNDYYAPKKSPNPYGY